MLKAVTKGCVAAVLGLLWVYRKLISPLKPPCCRFQPTCSEYAGTAVRRFGLGRGLWLTLRRLLRCHPFYRGDPCDPVPDAAGDRQSKPSSEAGRYD